MFFIDPVYTMFAYTMVMAHGSSGLDRFLADDLLDRKVIFVDLIFRSTVNYIVPVYEIEVDSVRIAV